MVQANNSGLSRSEVAEEEPCAQCGHAYKWHSEKVIAAGRFGEGGRCGWFRDPMFGATEECAGGADRGPCQGFAASGPLRA